jgi:hypothetical protein
MASTYTSRIRLEKQADGENPNSWGLILNQNVIDLIDDAIAGYQVVSVSNTGVTLTTGNGAADQARKSGLRLEGTLTADVTVAIPAQEKIYFVHNGTTGGYNVLFKAGSGTAVTATEAGKSMMIATDGTNINLFKNEDNDSKIYSNFLVPDAITANGAVDTSATKSIYQRVNTGSNDVTVSVSVGGLGIGQYVIVDKVTTTNKMTISWDSGSQGISLSSATELAIGIYNGNKFSFVETIKA